MIKIDKLAARLRDAFGHDYWCKWHELPFAYKKNWYNVAKVAIAEIGPPPKKKIIRKRVTKPKSCSIVGGKRVCK